MEVVDIIQYNSHVIPHCAQHPLMQKRGFTEFLKYFSASVSSEMNFSYTRGHTANLSILQVVMRSLGVVLVCFLRGTVILLVKS